MHTRASRGAVVSFLLAGILAGCSSKGTSAESTARPRTDAELLAMKPAGTNALIVHVAGYGYGTIAASPDTGLTCTSWDHEGPQLAQLCWQYVPASTSSVTLTATAGASSQFAGWYGPTCGGTSGTSCSVPMTRDQIVGASFVPAPPGSNGPFLLSVDVLGTFPGTITTSPDVGLSCATIDEQTNYAQRCWAQVPKATPPTQVTLSADPGDAVHVFGGWGGACSGTTGSTCTVTLSKDVSVTARFPTIPSGVSQLTNCGDLAEYDVSRNWSSYSYQPSGFAFATTVQAIAGAGLYRGQTAVRALTSAAFDFALVYSPAAPLDVSGYEQLRFAVRALNPNSGWQGNFPLVVLQDSSGHRQSYTPQTNLMPSDGVTWVPVTVPLGGGAGWTLGAAPPEGDPTRIISGSVNLSAISRIEIHSNTWDWLSYTVDVDGLSFEHPAASCPGDGTTAQMTGSWIGYWAWTDSPTQYTNADFELVQSGTSVSGIAFTGIGNSLSGSFDGTWFDYTVRYTGRSDYDLCTATISPAPTGAQLRASCTWYVSNQPSRAYSVFATQHVCAAGRTACSGSCVPLLTDFANCGACGNACAAGQVCNAGQCTAGTAVDVSGTWSDVATLTVCGFGCGTGVGHIYTSPLNFVSDGAATFHGTYFGVAVRGSVNGNAVAFGYDNFATGLGPAQGQCSGIASASTMDLVCDEYILSSSGLLLNGTSSDHATKP